MLDPNNNIRDLALVLIGILRDSCCEIERDFNEIESMLVGVSIDNPEMGWNLICEVISFYQYDVVIKKNHNPDKSILGQLGTGPLEDILSYHGDKFIERIEAKASTNTLFRWVLSCVWQSDMSEALWCRVQKASNAII